MWYDSQVEASKQCSERIHPRQNKGDRSLLNIPQRRSKIERGTGETGKEGGVEIHTHTHIQRHSERQREGYQ